MEEDDIIDHITTLFVIDDNSFYYTIDLKDYIYNKRRIVNEHKTQTHYFHTAQRSNVTE